MNAPNSPTHPAGIPALVITDYTPEWHDAFRSLNREWIDKYFVMEEANYKALDHPGEKILGPGGAILMALRHGQAVGTCALIRMDEETFELAKMGVAPDLRGQGIGWALGKAALAKARQMGATKVYLETNSKLQPAIRMYEKLGFRHVYGRPSPYERSDVQMEIDLNA